MVCLQLRCSCDAPPRLDDAASPRVVPKPPGQPSSGRSPAPPQTTCETVALGVPHHTHGTVQRLAEPPPPPPSLLPPSPSPDDTTARPNAAGATPPTRTASNATDLLSSAAPTTTACTAACHSAYRDCIAFRPGGEEACASELKSGVGPLFEVPNASCVAGCVIEPQDDGAVEPMHALTDGCRQQRRQGVSYSSGGAIFITRIIHIILIILITPTTRIATIRTLVSRSLLTALLRRLTRRTPLPAAALSMLIVRRLPRHRLQQRIQRPAGRLHSATTSTTILYVRRHIGGEARAPTYDVLRMNARKSASCEFMCDVLRPPDPTKSLPRHHRACYNWAAASIVVLLYRLNAIVRLGTNLIGLWTQMADGTTRNGRPVYQSSIGYPNHYYLFLITTIG